MYVAGNPPSHLFASGFFFDAGPGFLTMTTPEEEEEEAAVEEDMLTAVRSDAALNKDKTSVSSAGKSSALFLFRSLYLLLCFSLFSFSPALRPKYLFCHFRRFRLHLDTGALSRDKTLIGLLCIENAEKKYF